MFDNIGNKIKTLAKIMTTLGIIISVIYGIILIFSHTSLILAGLLVIILGSFSSWVSSFVLYGFGEIIDQLQYSNQISKKLHDILNKKEDALADNFTAICTKTNETQSSEHKWVCDACGKLRNQSPCPYCGNK